jgi:hypothetical protein
MAAEIAMAEYHFSVVQVQDRGRGYFAVDILSWFAYAGVVINGFVVCGMAVKSQSFLVLLGLLHLPITVLGIYVARLLIRAVLVWRDAVAEDGIDS